jgi:hypothetical protein
MGLLEKLGSVAREAVAELDAGALPGDVLARGARRATVCVAREAVERDEVRAGVAGAVLGVTLGETARRLKRGDVDGALDAAADGAATARAVWKNARR